MRCRFVRCQSVYKRIHPVTYVHALSLSIAALAVPVLLGSQASHAASPATGDVVLVLGADGGIGRYVCRELRARGYKVRGLTRQAASSKGLDTDVEWVVGDLNKKADLAPAMKGVKKVIFAAGAHGFEDLENNRRIYSEAVAEIARLGKAEGTDRFLLISSAGMQLVNPLSDSFQDPPPISKYLRDVLKWKLRGEQLLRNSGLPYTIIRAYSLNNNAANIAQNKDDTAIAIFQGEPKDVGGVISRENLAQVTVECVCCV